MPHKPAWMLFKEAQRERDLHRSRRRRLLLDGIKDLCFDIDVILDRRPASTYEAVRERLGERPTLHQLEAAHARLLRWASQGCPAEDEEVVV